MLSFLLAPFLALLTVFGLYLPPSPPSRPYPSAITRPAPIVATTSASDATTTQQTTPAAMPALVVPKKAAPTIVPKPAAEPIAPPRHEPVVSTPEPTPPPQPEPKSTPIPNDFSAATELAILTRMNMERANEGLPPLENDEKLSTLARGHSADMIARDYFSHTDTDGCGSSCRANAAGYAWRAIGENNYMSSGYGASPEQQARMVVDGWMKSPGHRANILGSQYTHAGVGVFAQGEDVYVTAMYAKPR